MARKKIFVDSGRESTIRQVWDVYTAAQTAKGVSDITLRNYKQHLHSISKYLDIDMPIVDLSKNDLDLMVVAMRQSGMAHNMMVVILRDYMAVRRGDSDDYLFCDQFGEMLSENALRLAIAKYNRRRGVSKTSIHMFRHTFARKYLVDCGGDAFSLQRLMGHSTLKMTKHYCSIFDADIARNYDRVSPLAQLQKPRETIKR